MKKNLKLLNTQHFCLVFFIRQNERIALIKKTLTISTIGLIAIVMGLSTISPAMAQEPSVSCSDLLDKILEGQVKAGKISEEEKTQIIEDTCIFIF